MKIDVLVFAVHPDDAELACSGTIAKLTTEGKKVGIIDLTRGELGSRGSADLRDKEAAVSAKIMGLSVRDNLRFRDGFFRNDEAHQIEIIRKIRQYRPEIVIANAPFDRHPDHGRASDLVREAFFLAGLRKIETKDDQGIQQEAFRPKRIFYYIQDHHLDPSFVIDVSPFYETKMKSIKAFSSQFYNPESNEPNTYISSADFWHFLEARARHMGHLIGVTYGEGFISHTPLKIDSPLDLV